MKNDKKPTHGFTLIEILIVVAIIGIISAAAIIGSSGIIRALRFGNSFNKIVFMIQQARSLASAGKDTNVQQYGVYFDLLTPARAILFGRNNTLDEIPSADKTIEKFVLPDGETLSATDLSAPAAPCAASGEYFAIRFRNGNAQTSSVCEGNPITNLKVTLSDEVLAREKSFSINQAAGIPQVQ